MTFKNWKHKKNYLLKQISKTQKRIIDNTGEDLKRSVKKLQSLHHDLIFTNKKLNEIKQWE